MKSLLIMLSALTGICGAQSTPSIVNTPGSPIRIVSITCEPDDLVAALTLRNESGANITSVTFGLVVTIPSQCGAKSFRSREHLHTAEVSLEPLASTALSKLHVSTTAMQRIAQLHGADDVFGQIAVIKVVYRNGQVWKLTRTGQVYDDDMLARTASQRCKVRVSTVLVDGQMSCATGKLVRVGMQGYNGSYYTCETGVGQQCSNDSIGGSASCTNHACPHATSCPDQACRFHNNVPPPPPPPPTEGSGCVDPESWWCGGDSGNVD